ncbi:MULTISPECIES: hypothetical protein [unclassified Streptomyces]|uniref:hypothetical protein n=1 Tax=unclassified Streptomyces TaxID=2593676 RepID=UPI002E17428D|nr:MULTISPECIES: hypothetical protein [unclassified Streptomyces]
MHGGFIATTLDEACGATVMSGSEPLTPFLTMSVNYPVANDRVCCSSHHWL